MVNYKYLIQHIIDNHKYIIDQELLDFLQSDQIIQGGDSNKNALLLEWTMKQKHLINTLPKLPEEKYQWRHDWALSKDPLILIDLKRKPNKYSNISISNPELLIESHQKQQLTHIVAYSQSIENVNKFNLGQTLEFKFVKMIDVLKAVKDSKWMDGYKLLNVE
jgi:hypothetical protein